MSGRPYGPVLACALGCLACQANDDLVVGVSWNNFQQPRWAGFDKPAIQAVVEEAGGTYLDFDANLDSDQQAADIDTLIEEGADAILVIAQDYQAVAAPVGRALDAGVVVVAYDRLVEEPDVLFMSFDMAEIGRSQAREVLEAAPTGNYVLIKGDEGDPNAHLLRDVQMEVLQPAIDAGDIVIVGETFTDAWRTEAAQEEMAAFLDANSNNVDAAVCENDSTALGAVAALMEVDLAGIVAVSGQDGDQANLNLIARGFQTVSVWKDPRQLGRAAALAALDLVDGAELEDIDGTAPFETPGGTTLTAVLLEATPITADNLDLVLDAGWIDEDTLCDGVPSGTVDACP